MSDELDLHGCYPDDAIEKLDNFIYRAEMSHFKQIRIIHGRGRNVLRSRIHSFLMTHPLIESFEDSNFPQELMAVTIARMNPRNV